MKVSLEKEGKNVVRLGLELEAEKALKAYELECRQLSHQVDIPGFRRGKVPRNIIENRLGVDYIKHRALERLVPELLSKAISEESLDVITEPEIDRCDFELGSPLKLQAKFEVRPEVHLGEYKGISIEVFEAKLPDDALSQALKTIADSKASLQPVPARPVEKGDMVLLDFECYVDDKLVEGGKTEGWQLEIKEEGFVPGFCEQVIGKQPNEKFDVNVKFPAEYRNKELAGKDAVFKVDLREIRQKVVPDVNDELAKVVGYESLQALEEALQLRLDEEVKQENEFRAQRKVVEAIVSSSSVDIPESMIERERELLIHQLRRAVEQNNQNWDDFVKRDDFEALRQGKFEEARQRVLTSLVLGAVVRAEKMTVTEDEMTPFLAELMTRYNIPVEQVARSEELRRSVMEEVLTNKVVFFLLNSANITYVPEPPMAEHEHGEHCDHEHEGGITASTTGETPGSESDQASDTPAETKVVKKKTQAKETQKS